jgi:hypothetical protein
LNVAGMGAVLTTTANLGLTEIRRGSRDSKRTCRATLVFARYFEIIPSNNSNLNATLRFSYDYSELDTFSESGLGLFSSTNGGANYSARGGSVDTAGNFITLNNISDFSKWTAGLGARAANIKVSIEGFVATGTPGLVIRDTVTAYLANNFSPFALIDSARSVIDSVTFNGTFLFGNAVAGNYYIVIKHRNSIQTWSKSGGESYSVGSTLNYNFTSSQSQATGNNLALVNTKWSDFSGDVNQDETVDVTDLIEVYNDARNLEEGYINTDVNGDYFADVSDLLMTFNNSNNVISVIKP